MTPSSRQRARPADTPSDDELFTTVNVGVATDTRMIPDPLHLAELVERGLTALAQTADENSRTS